MLYISRCDTMRRSNVTFITFLMCTNIYSHTQQEEEGEKDGTKRITNVPKRGGKSRIGMTELGEKRGDVKQTNNLQRWHPEMVFKALGEERR